MPTLVKVRKSGYTKVSNICFFDKRLSFKDVGLYCSMLSLPDNWEWSLNGLQQLHTDGKDSIRTSVNNLLKYGYISRQQTKDDRGKYSHIQYFIYNGIFYLSFKYGDFEGYRNDRYFTDYQEDTFAQLIAPFHELTVVEHWISSDARPGRSDEKWLNVIMVKLV